MTNGTSTTRPGRARSRNEAEACASVRPCPQCGAANSTSATGQPIGPPTGTWQVHVLCARCHKTTCYVFDVPAGWRDDEDFATTFGPPGTQSEILSVRDLEALRSEAIESLARWEELAAEGPENAELRGGRAAAAAAVLRTMNALDAPRAESLPWWKSWWKRPHAVAPNDTDVRARALRYVAQVASER